VSGSPACACCRLWFNAEHAALQEHRNEKTASAHRSAARAMHSSRSGSIIMLLRGGAATEVFTPNAEKRGLRSQSLQRLALAL
jgi:hypothetical protein